MIIKKLILFLLQMKTKTQKDDSNDYDGIQ